VNDDELARLAKKLPELDVDERRVASVRHGVLTEVARTPQLAPSRQMRPVAVAAAVLVASLIASLWALREPPARAPRLARVAASGSATFEHVVEGNGDTEVVLLRDGAVRIEAVHLEPGQRFLVATNDAEVEVRGTVFEVEAREGALVRVAVISGRVEVRRTGQDRLILEPHQAWAKDDPTPVEHPAERAFREAWQAFAGGRFADAARAFADADEEGSPVREEARYWRAVALLRAGDDRAAERAFRGFLKSYPGAPRGEEAALLLGRALLGRGDAVAAKPWLERAAKSEDARVRERAEALLESRATPPAP
jgi:hypothetical protein